MVEEQAGPEDPGRARSPALPPPSPADVGIVAAMPIEVGYLIDRLEQVRRYDAAVGTIVEGIHQGKLIALLVGGVGRKAAHAATETLLDGHRPRWIVSAGFGGALRPHLKRLDIVLPDVILGLDGQRYAIDVTVGEPPQGVESRIHRGSLLTVDTIVRTSAEKAALHARWAADLVDMETLAVATVCAERSQRFLSIRVVSDTAETDLPREVETLMNRSGAYLVGSALRAIWNRPSSLKDLISLGAQAQECADTLADATLALIGRLPT